MTVRSLAARAALACAALTLAAAPAAARAPAKTDPMTPDIPAKFTAPTAHYDYVKRVEMIPMRDGVKLYTVIVVPKGARDAPILLTRTPYNAKRRAARNPSPHVEATLAQLDEDFVRDGYIRVYQDVRGKHGSQGDYVVTRPLAGPLNKTKVDHSTDAYDTIEWLVKHVRESNGRVGMIGSSYDGFTVVNALINPHPALKAAVPQSPMIDGWMGDDWFHYGAFRQIGLDFFAEQMTSKSGGDSIPRDGFDDYENFRRAGSAGDFARAAGLEQIAFWRKIQEHPAYDDFWRLQALDKILADQPLKVPTLWVGSLFDQEDIYGAPAAYAATEAKDARNDMNFLALGAWRHSGVNYEQRALGAYKLPGDTATQFRREYLKPFLDQRLKTDGPRAETPPVLIYQTGTDRWLKLDRWPLACAGGCQAGLKPLYLQPGKKLGFAAPAGEGFEEYVSDPANPVPYVRRPVRSDDADQWRYWLTTDQRHVDGRPDVLTYVSEPLTAPVTIAGAPIVNLFASTSGSDADWVVKLIDVYPDTVPSQVEMGGYQLPVAMDIFRGRYRESFAEPKAIPAGAPQRYRFALPNTNHVFRPGHRIMVQIQSSWFPLYDRNPQSFVPNIFDAKPEDYRKATQRIHHGGVEASAIELPVVSGR